MNVNADGFLVRNPISVVSLRLSFPQSVMDAKLSTYL